ncbi:helix-turn-helix transcriptional regulator [Boudabousia marimammalium]|uniref:helix-turn-helix transcriptional regulator n=1 Tax=Boudabousia marimammalium TaxID=156892 RepID=UPI00094DCF40|nr:hypothetical protein [Boudabousia marimammalium]
MPTRYLAAAAVARRLGLSVNTISGYIQKGMLPPPDAVISAQKGRDMSVWLPETIDEWQANRPRVKRQSGIS